MLVFGGVCLFVLTKCFLQVRKVGFKIPNSMKIIFFEEGVRLFEGGMLIVSTQISRGYVYWGATLIRNSRVLNPKIPFSIKGGCEYLK